MAGDEARGTGGRRGRGAGLNLPGRFETRLRVAESDGWEREEALPPLCTTVTAERARSIVSRNDSPDVPFQQTLNPYRGCEHGCIYCYARPTHAYLDLSPGLDFESRLVAKPDAAALLEAELRRPGYRCRPLGIGTNTDAYQPIEREWRITRQVLELLARFRHPCGIVTKSALVERDIDLLAPMAADGLATVCISIATLDAPLARALEPRAASPARRLETIRRLAAAGIPVGVLAAPLIPGLTDHTLEAVLAAARQAGAVRAAAVTLRLPHEVAPLFEEWLERHAPLRKAHVLSLLRQCHDGELYDGRFGQRMTGSGAVAALLLQRFRVAARRLGFGEERRAELECSRFTVPPRPPRPGDQLPLF